MQVVYKLYDVEYRKYRAGQLKRGEMSRKYHDIFDRRVEIFLCSNKLSIGIPDFSAKHSRTINNGAAVRIRCNDYHRAFRKRYKYTFFLPECITHIGYFCNSMIIRAAHLIVSAIMQ